MKRMVGILAVLLATTFSAFAGEEQSEPQHPDRVLQRFQEVKDRLSLTPEQAEQVRPLLVGVLLSMKAVRDDYGVENQTRRSRRRMARELRAIRSHADERLKLILSRAQMEELKTIRKEWRDEISSWAALGTR
ncbi:MAG TPA: hypothetical protein VGS98_00785 [Thermoanaerobaculia bacterium]|nr:hypothetical protein [Thermoanaerobaculia bacterium]